MCEICNNSTRLPIGPAGSNGTNGTNGTNGADGNTIVLSAFGSTPNANGLSLAVVGTVGTLNMQPASASFGGGVSTTTQTFAGAKTFNVIPNSFALDANGVGIGTTATAHIFVNKANTFTSALGVNGTDVGSQFATTFTYTGANDIASSSSSLLSASTITGAYSPSVVYGSLSLISNTLNAGVTLIKSIVDRSSLIIANTSNSTITDNVNYISSIFSNKANAGLTTAITNNYAFYSAMPYDNAAGSVPGNFSISNQFGFYCEDYTLSSNVPFVQNGGAGKNSAVISYPWQFYADGTNLVSCSSYIGHRLAIGWAIAPTDPSLVTGLLHLGAGQAAASKAPLKFTTGTNLTAPEAGAMEYSSGRLLFTDTDAARRHIVQAIASTKTIAGAPYTNDGYVTIVINGTSVKVMTTA